MMTIDCEEKAQGPGVSGASREAIASLKASYCQSLDGKQWDRWGSLFTEDAVLQLGPSADAAVRGRAAIQRLLARQLRGARTRHEATNPEMLEQRPGRVRVVWEMKDSVETPLYVLDGAGFYEDRYVQTSEGWRIAALRLHRTKVELRPKSFVMRALLWMHARGWLSRLAPGADRLLSEALYVGLEPGQRP
jgi:3-phenylpropionate/cinnamic acid dioxygenase small subunit